MAVIKVFRMENTTSITPSRYNRINMSWNSLAVLLLCASCAWAQAEDPEVVRARMDLMRVQSLVQTGALPPVQLQKAKDTLADAEDGAVIHRDIQQQDLTEEQADALVAAAERRFERRKQAFDEAKKLVESGIAP